MSGLEKALFNLKVSSDNVPKTTSPMSGFYLPTRFLHGTSLLYRL